MPTESIEDLYELSPVQHGMLFHTLYAPHAGTYIDQTIYRLEGPLEASLLYDAWQHIVARHPPLRTAFLWEEVDDPLQVVYQTASLPWQYHDWRDTSITEQHTRLEELLATARREGFDLTQPPLMRIELLRVADEAHYLVWMLHHLLLDGWSSAILLQEVMLTYRALQVRRAPMLKQRRPFRDYIGWLRRRTLSEAETFWQHYLQGVTAPTPLPIDPPGSRSEITNEVLAKHAAQPTQLPLLQGGRPVQLHGFLWPEAKLTALRHMARRYQLTLNTLLQGAWALLLSRYSGERDVVFGVTSAGRPVDLIGSDTMIGLFINTLPMRARLLPGTKLLPWLTQLQKEQAEARQYDYTPLVQIQGWSEIPRDRPLFESLVVFENYPIEALTDENAAGALELHGVQDLAQTNYPLVLVLGVLGNTLSIQLGYETARFSRTTIQRLTKHLENILTAISQHAEMCLDDLSLMDTEERERVLHTWNATHTPFHPERSSIVAAFREQALHEPDRIALVCGEHQLTYAQLEQCSDHAAYALRNVGIGPEMCVGVYMERSIEWAIALLGILKSGGEYLPLDPHSPQERLHFMLTEAQVAFILTCSAFYQRCTALMDNIILIEKLLHQSVDTPFPLAIQTAQAAYTLYTSGSTGKPKGVVVTHQALLNHAYAVKMTYALHAEDRVLQFASMNFDVALEELLASWVAGACVVIQSEQIVLSPADFSRFIGKEALSMLNIPSSYWHEWVADLAQTGMPISVSVRLVVIGSEKASSARLATWQRIVGETIALYNAYGLTETTITSLIYAPQLGHIQAEHLPLPVGRPLANMEAYILDECFQPVPVGVPGNLFIGGSGLARGYVHNAPATAASFLPHPFSTLPGARLYHTGDRARYLPDGNIELLGRHDAQIKLRGFRIELGEIEMQIMQQSAVQETVVLAREDKPGEIVLVAYLVLRQPSPLFLAKLRRALQNALPTYMIPTIFVPLEMLPRLSTGKIDIRALPAPQQKHTQSASFMAPRTPVEEILASIWCAILSVERIGRLDNFFRLGGHSLQATQVVTRLREILQIEMPVRALYDAPTIAALATQIEQQRLQGEGQSLPAMQRVDRAVPQPLSFAQQRLWFLDQFQPGSSLYTLFNAFTLKGALDVKALTQSFQDLVQRHEVLRTTFLSHLGQPAQIIAPTLSLVLPVIQLSESIEPTRQAELLAQLTREEAQRPFNLTYGPLIRVQLVRLHAQEHVLMLTLHHIVADGWSTEIFFRELSALYAAHLDGQALTLPPLPIQYVDYAIWQRSWLQGEVLEHHLAYWRRQLADAPRMLELTTDRPRPTVQSVNGASLAYTLPPALLLQLHTLSREEGMTLFMTLLAGLQALLFRYTHQTDIVVGTPASGRTHTEAEQVIGLFLNVLALRVQVTGDLSGRDLLQRVRQVALDAYMHQDVPFEKLVDELQLERNTMYSPLFQVMLAFQNLSQSYISLLGLALQVHEQPTTTAKFDLTFMLDETATGLHLHIEYNTDLFEASTIARMARHYQSILEAIVAQPEQSLASLPLQTPDEETQLHAWNATAVVYPQPMCLHEHIEAIVARTPDAVALVFAEMSLTYRELNARANHLAKHLQALGVGPDICVALCMERSCDLVIALLGILKAGAAYLPLDPSYPTERLRLLLQDSQATVLLTHSSCLAHLPVHTVQVICMDTKSKIMGDDPGNPISHVQPENLAYVIYTSGSTGTPKGVLNTHSGICNRLLWMQETYQLGPDDSVLQKTPASFDVSVWEFFWPLIAGARLVLAQPKRQSDGPYLVSIIQEQQITTLHFVPSMLSAFLDMPGLAGCRSLRRVICSGEALSYALQQRYFTYLTAELYNLYGPTEAAVDVTSWTCLRESSWQTVPIGFPIANTRIYLLDEALQPVPIGLPGELYIAGAGLARGYLYRADLTAERFLPDPFSPDGGARLYRTGDLARYLPNGALEFLRRIDQQIKIRGYRIELGEIEAVLQQHPAVQHAVVNLNELHAEDRRLVAYIVTHPTDTSIPESALRAYLQEHLPAHMIPIRMLMLKELPLSPHGKLERKRLPAVDWSSAIQQKDMFCAPRTPFESTLAAIWSEVLGLTYVGVQDNFFEQGGDSIKILQIIARAHVANIQLTPKQLFQYQTIEQLAEVAVIAPPPLSDQSMVTGIVPLTPIQHWFFEQNLTDSHHYNQSLLLEATIEHPVLLEEAVNHLLQHHDALRLRFTHTSAGWQQQHVDLERASNKAFLYKDLTHLPPEQQRTTMTRQMAELQASLHLEQGPLFRVIFFNLAAQNPGRLLLIAHHLLIDAVSWHILLEDLECAYQQLSHNMPVRFPMKTLSFQHWAQRLTAYAASQTLLQEADYWVKQAQVPISSLPVDLPAQNQTANVEKSAQFVEIALSVAETRDLLQEVPRAYHTQINDVLLTTLLETLHAWTGTSAILLDLEGHGREHIADDIDLSRTVGWFTTIFPVRLDRTGTQGLGETLMAVKEQLRHIPGHGLSYGLLRYCQPDQNIATQLSTQPQAEISFNYLGQAQPRTVNAHSPHFRPAYETSGPHFSPRSRRKYLLDILVSVSSDQLRVVWIYSNKIHERATIERVAHQYMHILQELIAHCLSPDAGGHTPSDFPLAQLDARMLKKVAQLIEESE